MPIVRFRCADRAPKDVACPEGANLRMVLLRARLPLYTKTARALHCRGRGTCGTCAVEIEGAVSEPTAAETRRLRIAPHKVDRGLRLACQCNVQGDVTVTKHEGFFGHHTDDAATPDSPRPPPSDRSRR